MVRIRFSVADDPNNSCTEAAIDAVTVFAAVCPDAGDCRKSDVNLDGRIDVTDIAPFISLLLSGGPPGSTAFCAADLDDNGTLDGRDLPLFVDCLLAGECP